MPDPQSGDAGAIPARDAHYYSDRFGVVLPLPMDGTESTKLGKEVRYLPGVPRSRRRIRRRASEARTRWFDSTRERTLVFQGDGAPHEREPRRFESVRQHERHSGVD